MEKGMVFYLKVNRDNSYVIPNLKHWIEVAELYHHVRIYILCDNPKLKESILATLKINKGNIEILESFRNLEDMNKILKKVAEGKWVKVGQAHFTTFWHARQNNIKYFWNIDADDTYVCLDPVRLKELLGQVENYTMEKGVLMMGLDMWHSLSVAEKWETPHWSFGVTYVDNTFDWIAYMQKHYDNSAYEHAYEKMKPLCLNIDWFFTYLQQYTGVNIGTFYFENLKFIHFFDCFFIYPHKSGFYHWKNGKITFPIMKYCFGSHYSAEVPIAEDVVKFDIGIKEEEALMSLVGYSQERGVFYRDIQEAKVVLDELMPKRNRLYMEKLQNKEIVGWGAGEAFLRNYRIIKKFYQFNYVCDIDSSKWGKDIVDNVKCISPRELEELGDVAVMVMTDNMTVSFDIVRSLLDMGITNFDHVSHWLEYVQGIVD